MLKNTTVQLMALGLVGSFVATAAAQDSGALIDALVRKGVLKDQEAEEIRSQMTRDFAANSSAGKLNLSSSIKELKLSGDMRSRYTNQNLGQGLVAAGNDTVQKRESRFRLRLRVNADYRLSDNVIAGFGLQTQSKNDSGNATLAKDTAGGNGYYENYTAFISKAYLGWTPLEGVALTGGKFANPMYTTDMFWDADINPAGFAERIDFHKFLNLGGLELSLVGLQGSVSDQAENNSGRAGRDGWVFQTQLIAAGNLFEGVKLTVAPGLYFTNGGQGQSAAAGAGEANAIAAAQQLRGLKILNTPGDVAFKVAGAPTKFFWDFAYNADAGDRAAAYNNSDTVRLYNPTGTDKMAFLAGLQYGENKKKGDWSVTGSYRQIGAAAVDSSINDSDWALSRTNMAGPKLSFVYNIGDAFTLGASYYIANNLRSDLNDVVGANKTPVDGNSVRVLQIDGVVKF